MDTFINVIGFSAGLLVAASLLPQIWRAHKRESAEDLSFFWQASDRTHPRCIRFRRFFYNLLRNIRLIRPHCRSAAASKKRRGGRGRGRVSRTCPMSWSSSVLHRENSTCAKENCKSIKYVHVVWVLSFVPALARRGATTRYSVT